MAILERFTRRSSHAPRIPPPAIAGATVLGALGLDRLIGRRRVLPSWTRPVGIAAAIGGIGVAAWALMLFRQRGTTFHPWEKPGSFVAEGPYRVTRNPMYAGTAAALFGFGLYRGTLPALLAPFAFVGLITRGQIAFEESALSEAFGEGYEAYRRKVRRWI